ncbi:hypothetical protein [Deinococcus peraridilitoris]|uniref:Uncharacterized protein n=1 Tax=Deinococcus peraridilitoris (strain DSM 19664 / LMG 22246 / CIP 109416 / KR-200) TaxID=937777 RepID=L0A3R3_DEIPD|nr:hypothetical protein [Deinococcus peraridilitoris]AFZ68074.1 hypothetical protein Deipe_2609 [Deinococcus peraridilitoris DSM 19664]
MREPRRILATRALGALLVCFAGQVSAEPLLIKGGGLLTSKFCAKYACQSLGTVTLGGATSRAYRLQKAPGVGVVSRVAGNRVAGMTLLLLDPQGLKDSQLLYAIGTVLPDFQALSFGERHRFAVSKQCLKSATRGKRLALGGTNLLFSCEYNNAALYAAAVRAYRLSSTKGVISVTYAAP